jgi:hypothetical protein
MTASWRPSGPKWLDVQAAYDDERVRFRFRWAQPNPGGWIHDMLVYRGGRWRRFADPSPWESDAPEHRGFYEDRISFFLDDGSVRGFEEFGGWLTTHEGMRSLPSAAPAAAVESHPHYGTDGLGKSDIRKYLPHACAGEWWEGDWRAVRSPADLARLRRDGVFLDLPMWRAHRSDPLGYGTDHHVLDYRHSDAGQNTYGTQAWDPDGGPTYMFDPSVVDDGALDYRAVRDGRVPEQGTGTYALTPENRVPFDPAVAEWEGAMVPRRPLRDPYGSAADWTATGDWADGCWTVEMERPLRTDRPSDTKQLEEGGVYQWAPAVHHGAGQRWHWVGYPRRLGLGVEPDRPNGYPEPIVATRLAPGADWSDVPTHTQRLVFPGVQTWTDLTDDAHPDSEAVRNLETTMWELHGRGEGPPAADP